MVFDDKDKDKLSFHSSDKRRRSPIRMLASAIDFCRVGIYIARRGHAVVNG